MTLVLFLFQPFAFPLVVSLLFCGKCHKNKEQMRLPKFWPKKIGLKFQPTLFVNPMSVLGHASGRIFHFGFCCCCMLMYSFDLFWKLSLILVYVLCMLMSFLFNEFLFYGCCKFVTYLEVVTCIWGPFVDWVYVEMVVSCSCLWWRWCLGFHFVRFRLLLFCLNVCSNLKVGVLLGWNV